MAQRKRNQSKSAAGQQPRRGAHAAQPAVEPQDASASQPAAPAAPQRTLGERIRYALPYIGLVVGLLIIAYFPIAEGINAWQRTQEADETDTAVSQADAELIEELLAQAEAYNAVLAGLTPDIPEDEILPYEEQLSLNGTDAAFGYVIIPEIDLTMPLYHGSSDAVLSAGAGHLETSSLPIGGDSTHAVITAHTGMVGMRAFDDINELEEGDVFGIKVLGQLVCYEVTGTEVVDPDETESLAIQADEDLCTLVTCTPYGVNSQRLLVHGERCEVPDWFVDEPSSPLASVMASGRMLPFIVAAAAVAALLVGLALWRRHKSKQVVEVGRHAK